MKNSSSFWLPVLISAYVFVLAWVLTIIPKNSTKGVVTVQAFCIGDEWVIRNPTSKTSVNPTFAKLVDEDNQGLPCVERPNDGNIDEKDRKVYK